MLSLDYAKELNNGYVLNFFADDIADIDEVSNGKEYITRFGMNYGVPVAGSTVTVTNVNSEEKPYVLSENGDWEEVDVKPMETLNFTIVAADIVVDESGEEKKYTLTDDCKTRLSNFCEGLDFSKIVSGTMIIIDAGKWSMYPIMLMVEDEGYSIGTLAGFESITANTATGKVNAILATSALEQPVTFKILYE